MTQWEATQIATIRGGHPSIADAYRVAEFFEDQGYPDKARQVREVADEIESDWADR